MLVALVTLALGLRLVVTGAPGNPALVEKLIGHEVEPGVRRLIAVLARHEGLAVLGWGIWLAWSSVRGFRSGERSVWYGWWTVPAVILGIRFTGADAGGILPSLLLGLAFLTVVALLLCRPASGATPGGSAEN